MFDELFGLPAHPLIVHAPVVLVPLVALVAVAYAVVPRLRRHLWWLLAPLALAAAGSAVFAVESGEALQARLGGPNPAITRHAGFGETLRNLALLLAVAAVALVIVDLSRRRAAPPRADGPGAAVAPARTSGSVVLVAVSVVLTVAVLVLAVAAIVYIVRVGHSGSEMVWGG